MWNFFQLDTKESEFLCWWKSKDEFRELLVTGIPTIWKQPSVVRKHEASVHKETKARDGKQSISTEVPGSRGAWDQHHPCSSRSRCSGHPALPWSHQTLFLLQLELRFHHSNLRVMKKHSSTAKSSHMSGQPVLPEVAPACTYDSPVQLQDSRYLQQRHREVCAR